MQRAKESNNLPDCLILSMRLTPPPKYEDGFSGVPCFHVELDTLMVSAILANGWRGSYNLQVRFT
jgi:hypothetical protein